jgi:hypothetical protein
VGGKPLAQPLLVDAYAATTRFRGAREVARTRLYRLLRPEGLPRLALYAPGRYFDGWLALDGSFRLWASEPSARLAGRLTFTLSLPHGADPAVATFRSPSGKIVAGVRPGEQVPVSLPVCATGSWRAEFQAPFTGSIGLRFVSVRSTEPTYRPDSRACS